jgi:hypothetical protein
MSRSAVRAAARMGRTSSSVALTAEMSATLRPPSTNSSTMVRIAGVVASGVPR